MTPKPTATTHISQVRATGFPTPPVNGVPIGVPVALTIPVLSPVIVTLVPDGVVSLYPGLGAYCLTAILEIDAVTPSGVEVLVLKMLET